MQSKHHLIGTAVPPHEADVVVGLLFGAGRRDTGLLAQRDNKGDSVTAVVY